MCVTINTLGKGVEGGFYFPQSALRGHAIIRLTICDNLYKIAKKTPTFP